MRGTWLLSAVGLAGLACGWGCETITGAGGNGGGTTTGAGGNGGGTTIDAGGETCTPGSVEPCYTGPADTLGAGICTAGLKTCNPEGTGYGDCIGEVLPQPEACGNLTDDDCNGQTNESGAGCACLPGSTVDCPGTYSGPPGTEGVGACHGQLRTCNAEGTGYSECTGEVLPQVETCNSAAESPADEDCDGQTNEGVCKFVAVAGAGNFSLFLRSDGTVWATGENGFYQLGNGTTAQSSIPVQVSKLDRVTAIRANAMFALALRSDGTVWTWGNMATDTTPHFPQPVPGLSGMTAISAGFEHALAMRSDGTVWAWGWNFFGKLGDGTETHQESPVQVLSLLNAAAIAAGMGHSLGVDTGGGVWAWGGDLWGEVGQDDMYAAYTVPIPVAGVDHVTAISAGEHYSLALRSDGSVWAWGAAYWGALGIEPIDSMRHPTPVAVMNLSSVTAIAASRMHALALRSDGTVWAWGQNDYGQLGNGTTEEQTVPAMVPMLSNVVAISGGWDYSLALQSDGTAWAWGRNLFGALGIGTLDEPTTPTKVVLP